MYTVATTSENAEENVLAEGTVLVEVTETTVSAFELDFLVFCFFEAWSSFDLLLRFFSSFAMSYMTISCKGTFFSRTGLSVGSLWLFRNPKSSTRQSADQNVL